MNVDVEHSDGDAHNPSAKNEPYGLEMPLGYVRVFEENSTGAKLN